MSVFCKSLLNVFLIFLLPLIFQSCTKPKPKEVGETYTEKRGYIVVPGKGKLVIEVGSYRRPLNCMKETERKVSRIILRKSGYVYPTQVSCDQEKNRLTFETLSPLEKGNVEYILRPFEYIEPSELHLQHYIIFEDPDFDSGDDRIFSGAVALQENQTHSSTLNARKGDFTDWISFTPSTKFFSLHFESEPKRVPIRAKVFTVTKGGKLLPKTRLVNGKQKSFTGSAGQKYAIQIQGHAGAQEQKYQITARVTRNSPTRKISVMDAYKEVDGQVTVVIASQNLRGVSPGTSLSVFERRGSGTVSLGQCSVPGASPSVTYCIIKKPTNMPQGGTVFAKFELSE